MTNITAEFVGANRTEVYEVVPHRTDGFPAKILYLKIETGEGKHIEPRGIRPGIKERVTILEYSSGWPEGRIPESFRERGKYEVDVYDIVEKRVSLNEQDLQTILDSPLPKKIKDKIKKFTVKPSVAQNPY